MPAKDLYHEQVKRALIKDGWTITHDPYHIAVGLRDVYIDLGAERPIAAEKDGVKVAVEIKTFRGASDVNNLENALGQYVFYRSLMSRSEPGRKLILAVPEAVYETFFQEPVARQPLEDLHVALMVFDYEREVILKWIE